MKFKLLVKIIALTCSLSILTSYVATATIQTSTNTILMPTLENESEAIEHKGGCIPYDRSLLNNTDLYEFDEQDDIPSLVDMSKSFPEPKNQYDQNSCVGWAVAYACKSYQDALDHNWAFNTSYHIFSPSYIYNQINGGVDKGSYVEDAMNLVAEQGVCTFQDMPYTKNYRTQPTNEQRKAAYPHRSYPYEDGSNYKIIDTVDGIKHALAAGEAVVLDGLRIRPDLEALDISNQVYNNSNGATTGYHAVCAVGYDDSKKAVKFINSWGTQWGLHGFGYISYDLMAADGVTGFIMQDYIETLSFEADEFEPNDSFDNAYFLGGIPFPLPDGNSYHELSAEGNLHTKQDIDLFYVNVDITGIVGFALYNCTGDITMEIYDSSCNLVSRVNNMNTTNDHIYTEFDTEEYEGYYIKLTGSGEYCLMSYILFPDSYSEKPVKNLNTSDNPWYNNFKPYFELN